MTPVSSVPGVTMNTNPLTPIPGTPVSEVPRQAQGVQAGGMQTGGNPWAAFLMAAKEAAPAALLLGAYATLPERSSGLRKPKTRKYKRKI